MQAQPPAAAVPEDRRPEERHQSQDLAAIQRQSRASRVAQEVLAVAAAAVPAAASTAATSRTSAAVAAVSSRRLGAAAMHPACMSLCRCPRPMYLESICPPAAVAVIPPAVSF